MTLPTPTIAGEHDYIQTKTKEQMKTMNFITLEQTGDHNETDLSQDVSHPPLQMS